jgi:hypothetical protein
MTTSLERERLLRKEIERELTEIACACASDVETALMREDAIAPKLRSNEILLLGQANKYAGLVGKEVRIVRPSRQPS